MKADKNLVLRLLKTARGQIEGLIKMVEDDRYCIDISNQVLATTSILKKINLEILRGHFTHCVKNTLQNGTDADIDKSMDEITGVLDKLIK